MWSRFSSKEQLVGCVELVSHATFVILYQAIRERMTFWQNGWIVSASENELRKRDDIIDDAEDWFWLWKLLNHWCHDLHAKPLHDHPMKFGGPDFVVYSSTMSGYSTIYPVISEDRPGLPLLCSHLLWSSARSVSCYALVVDMPSSSAPSRCMLLPCLALNHSFAGKGTQTNTLVL